MKKLTMVTRIGLTALVVSGAMVQHGSAMKSVSDLVPQTVRTAFASIRSLVKGPGIGLQQGGQQVVPQVDALQGVVLFDAATVKAAAKTDEVITEFGKCTGFETSAAALVGEHLYTEYVTKSIDEATKVMNAKVDSAMTPVNHETDDVKVSRLVSLANNLAPEAIEKRLGTEVVVKADTEVSTLGAEIVAAYDNAKGLLLESDALEGISTVLPERCKVLTGVTTCCKNQIGVMTAKSKADIAKLMQATHEMTGAQWLAKRNNAQANAITNALSGLDSI